MAQKGKKKPSEGDQPRRKGRNPKKGRDSSEPDRQGSGSADWAPGTELDAGETETLLDADPVREMEDKAREFGPSDNPFLPRDADRLPEENPYASAPPEGEEDDDLPGREKTQPSLGEKTYPLRQNLDPPGMVAAGSGQGRASAEDVPRSRSLLPGSGFLDALFLDFPFPADMEAIACHLAQDAHLHGGPAETFHDLVIQLDRSYFKDVHDLKNALGDRFAWESAHSRPEGGNHGR